MSFHAPLKGPPQQEGAAVASKLPGRMAAAVMAARLVSLGDTEHDSAGDKYLRDK